MTAPFQPDPQLDRLVVNTIRGLAIDAIQAANSGHPGMPLGMADAAYVLWSRFLRFDPSCPTWPDRDRFVLSAGHGSTLLYSLLYLTGTALELDDLKRFRQLGSRTAGHPEYGLVPMVETTTGPLGQGFANAVGMAMAEKQLSARFGADLCSHRTYAIAGDGCLMEGISNEAASLAGHLRLGNLIVLYDDNGITIDGSTGIAFTEDVAGRFTALHWHVQKVDGHDHEAVAAAIVAARADPRPSLVCCRTTIGYGSPNRSNTSKVHGSPLGEAELRLTKQALGLDPEQRFAVPPEVLVRFRQGNPERQADRLAWESRLQASPLADEWKSWMNSDPSAFLANVRWPVFAAGTSVATRQASGKALAAISAAMPNLMGGSADLAASNDTDLPNTTDFQADTPLGRNLRFGIREHAMAAICSGIVLHGGLRPYCATFLVFHDYMRPSVRLAAMMGLPVVYVFTHDSIYLGEDGPTHQPIEHLMGMRLQMGLTTIRPADPNETVEAWKIALSKTDGPVALVLTRQGLPALDRNAGFGPVSDLARGGYVLREPSLPLKAVIIGSGSEVHLALEAQDRLQALGIGVRVVNLASWELFAAQDPAWRSEVLPMGIPRVAVEAGRTLGWERWVGLEGAVVGIDRYGESAPPADVARHLGLTVDAVVAAVHRVLGQAF